MTFLHFLAFVGTLSLHCSNSESLGHLSSWSQRPGNLQCFLEANRTESLWAWLNYLCVMRGAAAVSGCHKKGYLVLVTKAGSAAGDKWGCLCSKNAWDNVCNCNNL